MNTTAPIPFAGQDVHPRCDADFIDRCLWDLIEHAGEWRRLGRLYCPSLESFERSWIIHDVVEWGRKCGMLIEGERGSGHRLVGFRHPAAVYRIKPGPKEAEAAQAEAAPQLRLVEVG